MQALSAFIASRRAIPLLVLIMAGTLVWFAGPYLALGHLRPLSGIGGRLVAILVLVCGWLGRLQLRQWRAATGLRRLADGLGTQAQDADADARIAEEQALLRRRFAETMTAFRKRGGRRRGLHAMPWYMLIGPPGSGKSTLLRNSGLNFPLLDGQGQRALAGIGGTRNCDWWLAEEAVFLDTAGRYTTQDSDARADAAAWEGFLALLRRQRPRPALDGVVVALSVAELMAGDEAERQRQARLVRRRVDELRQHLRARVPVYMVLTKCDMVAGFTAFFDDADAEARAQVWGMSFPWEDALHGRAPACFGEEFALLVAQLEQQVLARVQAEREPSRRAAILAFPRQMAAMQATLQRFVATAFAGDALDEAAWLRGIYLTSGTQEGTPVDRVLAAVAAGFGIAPAQVQGGARKPRTFFVERLLRQVVLAEAGIAAGNPLQRHRHRHRLVAACVALALFTAAGVTAMGLSYARNRDYLAQMQAAVERVPQTPPPAADAGIGAFYAWALERFEALRKVGETAVAHRRDGVPWRMRFGLYQGNALAAQSTAAYRRELNALLLPGAGALFRASMERASGDPQRLYQALRGYLMLGDPPHRDAAELAALGRIEWQRLFPDDPLLRNAMDTHFRALLQGADDVRALALDADQVEKARATLRAAELSTLVYGGLKLQPPADAPSPRLDRELGLFGDVFERASGAGLDEPLPAMFTREAFSHYLHGGIDAAVERFLADDWVLGRVDRDLSARSRLGREVSALYQQDYIEAWRAMLDDLRLRPVATLDAASAVAAKLGGPSSPLKGLLKLVERNTRDLAAGKATAARQDEEAGAASPSLPSGANADVDAAAAAIAQPFRVYHQLLDDSSGSTQLDQALAGLDALGRALLAAGRADGGGAEEQALALARQQATLLPPPLSDWVAALASRSRSLVDDGFSSAVGERLQQAAGADCGALTAGRFPFAPDSPRDIPLQDFAELFGSGGRFARFFAQTLAGKVDTRRAQWQWQDGRNATRADLALLQRMKRIDDIRAAYFGGGAQPNVSFTVQAPATAAGIGRLRLEVDGQVFEHSFDGRAGAAPVRMAWPGPQPGRVRLDAWDASGRALPGIAFDGEWALFRALRSADVRQERDLQLAADFRLGTAQLRLELRPASLRHPLLDDGIRDFRCP